MKLFPDNEITEKWFAEQCWGGTSACSYCDCTNVQTNCAHHMPYWCRKEGRRKQLSVRFGTIIQDSKLSYQIWALAIYIIDTGIKGVSSMNPQMDLDIIQKTAYHLAMRIRESWNIDLEKFIVSVEYDETYAGGKEKNKHKKLNACRGTVGKTTVVGEKDRGTNQVQAKVITDTTAETLTGFVYDTSSEDAQVYTNDFKDYHALKRATHKTVKYSGKEYVNEEAHISQMESFWALLKRGYCGTYHRMSPKHLQHYVNEFVGWHNIRGYDIADQMECTAKGMCDKMFTCKRLTRKTKLDSTAV